MNGLILMAAPAFVPATINSWNAGRDQCKCRGCCQTGSCECNSCDCACCVDESLAPGVNAGREACCGSGFCGASPPAVAAARNVR